MLTFDDDDLIQNSADVGVRDDLTVAVAELARSGVEEHKTVLVHFEKTPYSISGMFSIL